jgi:hypothetical protein
MSAVIDVCAKADDQYTAVQAANILFRQDPNEKYTNVGAAGRRFFSEGKLLYRWHIAA